MQLSVRLRAVADLVSPGHRVVDIGTDHAYIPIFLIEQKKCPHVIAMDVREGPLKKATAHIKAAGVEEKIETRLSDGFQELKQGEADTAILSGMGGALMIQIFRQHPEIVGSLKECVLQPQSEIYKLREFLLKERFTFLAENIVQEDGKFYSMMKLRVPQDGNVQTERWNETSLRYGKLLLEKRHPVLKKYLEKEQILYKRICMDLAEQTGERSQTRLVQLKKELEHIREGLMYYEV